MKAFNINFLLIALFLINLYGCNSDSTIPSDYVEWVKDETNGLLKTKNIGEVNLKVQYKPMPFIIFVC